jgi:Polyketide cyclase / dehydrase and lipid transport
VSRPPPGIRAAMKIAMRNRMPTVERAVAAPAPAVWDVLVDLDAWPRWGLTVSRAELDDADALRLGARGTVWTPIGVPLPFTITEFDAGHRWAWAVGGVDATRHGVDSEGPGCRVWMSAPLWAPAYLPVLALALRRIDAMVSA